MHMSSDLMHMSSDLMHMSSDLITNIGITTQREVTNTGTTQMTALEKGYTC